MQFPDLCELQRSLGEQCQKLQFINLRCNALINGKDLDFTDEEVAKAFEELKAARKESRVFSIVIREHLSLLVDGLVTSWIGETAKVMQAFTKFDAALRESRRLIEVYEAKARK
jgi:hypothetical protein